MPLLQVNAVGSRPELSGAMPLCRSLAAHIEALPPGAPIVVLIHGYKFSPFHARRDPHDHILSLAPRRSNGVPSWPKHLGFGRGRKDEGLCIAFGWQAFGTFWTAYREAEAAGEALAEMLQSIAGMTARPVDILGHSLGARVALTAVARAVQGNVGRVILMAAAEFQGPAARCLSSRVGQGTEFINVASRENDFFDLLVERLVDPFGRARRTLGEGLAAAHPNWLDIQIDHDPTRTALARFGHRIAAPNRRICHWSGYLRPGMLAFYTDLIRDRDRLSFARLQVSLPQSRDPRWSRFFGMKWPKLPLPFLRKPSF